MEQKYVSGIKAGLIGSVLLSGSGLISFLGYFVIWWMNAFSMMNASTCVLGILVLIFAAVTGMLAAYFAKGVATSLTDVLLASAMAGAVSGVIFVIVRIVLSMLNPLVVGLLDDYFHKYSYYYGGVGTGVSGSLSAGTCACACAPLTVVVIVTLAMIGGAIYGIAVMKLS